MSLQEEFLATIEEHNRSHDCFSNEYRLPIRLQDGTLSYVCRNGSTALDGAPTFVLPDGAIPLVCWEPAVAPWLPMDSQLITLDHSLNTGPTHPCPHCLQLRGTNGQMVWVWVDGELVGTILLQNSTEDE